MGSSTSRGGRGPGLHPVPHPDPWLYPLGFEKVLGNRLQSGCGRPSEEVGHSEDSLSRERSRPLPSPFSSLTSSPFSRKPSLALPSGLQAGLGALLGSIPVLAQVEGSMSLSRALCWPCPVYEPPFLTAPPRQGQTPGLGTCCALPHLAHAFSLLDLTASLLSSLSPYLLAHYRCPRHTCRSSE